MRAVKGRKFSTDIQMKRESERQEVKETSKEPFCSEKGTYRKTRFLFCSFSFPASRNVNALSNDKRFTIYGLLRGKKDIRGR